MLQARVLAPLSSVYATAHSSPGQETKHPTEEIWVRGPTAKWDTGLVNHTILTCLSSVMDRSCMKRAKHMVQQLYQRAGGASNVGYGKLPCLKFQAIATKRQKILWEIFSVVYLFFRRLKTPLVRFATARHRQTDRAALRKSPLPRNRNRKSCDCACRRGASLPADVSLQLRSAQSTTVRLRFPVSSWVLCMHTGN